MSASVAAVWISGLIFAVIHSFMASLRCKAWVRSEGLDPHTYRMGYSFLSLLLTLLWLFFLFHLPDRPLYDLNGAIGWLLMALQLAGVAVVGLSLSHVDALAFLGFRPFPDHIEPFRESGIYRHVRHPMYSGFMLILLASPEQSVNSFNLALFVALYFVVGSIFEERRMVGAHPHYADYRKRVPAFIPWRTLFSPPGRSGSRHE